MSSEEAVLEVRRIFATNTVEEAYNYLTKISHSVGESRSTLKELIGDCYEDIVTSCERVVAVSETCTTLSDLQERLESGVANDKRVTEKAAEDTEGVSQTDMLLYDTQQRLIAVEGLLDAHCPLEAAEALTHAKQHYITLQSPSDVSQRALSDLQTTITVYEERMLHAMRDQLVENSFQRVTQQAMRQVAQGEYDMQGLHSTQPTDEREKHVRDEHEKTMQRLRQYDAALRALDLPPERAQQLLDMPDAAEESKSLTATPSQRVGDESAIDALHNVRHYLLHDFCHKLDALLQPQVIEKTHGTLSILHLLLSLLSEQVSVAESLLSRTRQTATSLVSAKERHGEEGSHAQLNDSAQALQTACKVQYIFHLITEYIRGQYLTTSPSSTTDLTTDNKEKLTTQRLTLQQLALHARRLAQDTASTIRVKGGEESEMQDSSIGGLSAADDDHSSLHDTQLNKHTSDEYETSMKDERSEMSVRAKQDRSALRRRYVNFMLAAVHTTDELALVSVSSDTDAARDDTRRDERDMARTTLSAVNATTAEDWRVLLLSLQDHVIVPLMHILLVELCTDPMMLISYYVATMKSATCHNSKEGKDAAHKTPGDDSAAIRSSTWTLPLPLDAEVWCGTVRAAVQEALRRATRHALHYATRVHSVVVEEMTMNASLLLSLEQQPSSSLPAAPDSTEGTSNKTNVTNSTHHRIDECLSPAKRVCEALQLLNNMLLFTPDVTTYTRDGVPLVQFGETEESDEAWQRGTLGLDIDEECGSSSDDEQDNGSDITKSTSDVRAGVHARLWAGPTSYTQAQRRQDNESNVASEQDLSNGLVSGLPARWYTEGGLFATALPDEEGASTQPAMWDFAYHDTTLQAQDTSTLNEGDTMNKLWARREAVRAALCELNAGLCPHARRTAPQQANKAATTTTSGTGGKNTNSDKQPAVAAEENDGAATCGMRVLSRVLRQVRHMLHALDQSTQRMVQDNSGTRRVGQREDTGLPVQELRASYETWLAQALAALETRLDAIQQHKGSIEAAIKNRDEADHNANDEATVMTAHLFQLAAIAELYRRTSEQQPLQARADQLVRRCYEPWLQALTSGYEEALYGVYTALLDELRAECLRWPASTTSIAQLRGLYQLLHASRLRALSPTESSDTNVSQPLREGGEKAAVWYFPFQPAPHLARVLTAVQHMMLCVRGLNDCHGDDDEEEDTAQESRTSLSIFARLAQRVPGDVKADKSLEALVSHVRDVCEVATLYKTAHLPLLASRLVPEVYRRLRQTSANVVHSRILPLCASYVIQPPMEHNSSIHNTSLLGTSVATTTSSKGNTTSVTSLPCRALTELWLQLYFDLSFATAVWQSAMYHYQQSCTSKDTDVRATLGADNRNTTSMPSQTAGVDAHVQDALHEILQYVDAVDAAAVMPLLEQHCAALLCRSAAAFGLSHVPAALRERAAALQQDSSTHQVTRSATLQRSSFAVQSRKEVPRFAMLPVASVSALMLPALASSSSSTTPTQLQTPPSIVTSAVGQRMNSGVTNAATYNTGTASIVPAYGVGTNYVNSRLGGIRGMDNLGSVVSGTSSATTTTLAQDRFSVDVLRRALNGSAPRPGLGMSRTSATAAGQVKSNAVTTTTNAESMPSTTATSNAAAAGNSLWNSTQRGWSTFWRQ